MGLKTDRLVAAVLELLAKAGVPYSLDRRRGAVVFQVTPPATGADAVEARVRKLAELAQGLD